MVEGKGFDPGPRRCERRAFPTELTPRTDAEPACNDPAPESQRFALGRPRAPGRGAGRRAGDAPGSYAATRHRARAPDGSHRPGRRPAHARASTKGARAATRPMPPAARRARAAPPAHRPEAAGADHPGPAAGLRRLAGTPGRDDSADPPRPAGRRADHLHAAPGSGTALGYEFAGPH